MRLGKYETSISLKRDRGISKIGIALDTNYPDMYGNINELSLNIYDLYADLTLSSDLPNDTSIYISDFNMYLFANNVNNVPAQPLLSDYGIRNFQFDYVSNDSCKGVNTFPAIRLNDNKTGFFDIVSSQFYPSIGGELIMEEGSGPVKHYIIE